MRAPEPVTGQPRSPRRGLHLPFLVLTMLLAALAAVPEAAGQERYTVRDAIFLPQVFYVGDRVELRLRIRVDEGVALPASAAPPAVPWGTIHSVSAAQQEQNAELRIQFTAFRQGTLALPPLSLGEITIQGFDIYVETTLGENPELAPLRDQAALPSTNLIVAGTLSALILLPLLWIFFVKVGRSRVRRLVERYRANQPARRLRRSLRRLGTEVQELKGREFYIDLLQDLRRYISQKLGRDCMAATTLELQGYLEELLDDPRDRERVMDLFHYGDLVKFARRRAPVKSRRQHLETVRELVERLERSREQQVERGQRRSRRVGAS